MSHLSIGISTHLSPVQGPGAELTQFLIGEVSLLTESDEFVNLALFTLSGELLLSDGGEARVSGVDALRVEFDHAYTMAHNAGKSKSINTYSYIVFAYGADKVC